MPHQSPKTTAGLLASLASVFKSIPADKLKDIEDVVDLWNEPGGQHQNPSRAEIVTGPAERMSGDGAPKMIAEYSAPAPQQGLTAQYSEFQRMLDGWAKSFVADLTGKLNPILARHDIALKSIMGVFEAAQKAQTATPAAPAADSFVGKALTKIQKAKLALRKADMADDDEKEERKSHLAEASDLLKSAKRLLAKASEEDMEDMDDEGTEKAMTQLAALNKSVIKAQKDDMDWEAEEKAKAVAAQKAIDDAAAAVTKKAEEDKAKEEEEASSKAKAQSDAASKAMSDESVQKALEGLGVLKASMQDVINAVMGKSVNPVQPEIAKSTVVPVVDYATRLQEMVDNGSISEVAEAKVAQIVQHDQIAKAGRMDPALIQDEIAKSSAEVRAFFKVDA